MDLSRILVQTEQSAQPPEQMEVPGRKLRTGVELCNLPGIRVKTGDSPVRLAGRQDSKRQRLTSKSLSEFVNVLSDDVFRVFPGFPGHT